MIFGMYSVKDNLTNKFLQPLFIPTDEEAIRMFKYMLNNDAIWKSNPSHFDLWKIGWFDDEVGMLETDNKLIQGGTAIIERSNDA